MTQPSPLSSHLNFVWGPPEDPVAARLLYCTDRSPRVAYRGVVTKACLAEQGRLDLPEATRRVKSLKSCPVQVVDTLPDTVVVELTLPGAAPVRVVCALVSPADLPPDELALFESQRAPA